MDELQIKSGFDTFDDFTPPDSTVYLLTNIYCLCGVMVRQCVLGMLLFRDKKPTIKWAIKEHFRTHTHTDKPE